MSCVLGLLHEGNVYIASDGIATTDDGEKRPIIATKIYRNNGYLIGFAGSVRTGQLIGPRYFKPPSSIYDMSDAIREQLQEKGALLLSESQQHMNSANFIIAHEGRLFEILVDFQMSEIMGDFTGIGSGSPYAMGSLFATKRWNSPEKRLITALKAAREYDTSCGEPFTIEVLE